MIDNLKGVVPFIGNAPAPTPFEELGERFPNAAYIGSNSKKNFIWITRDNIHDTNFDNIKYISFDYIYIVIGEDRFSVSCFIDSRLFRDNYALADYVLGYLKEIRSGHKSIAGNNPSGCFPPIPDDSTLVDAYHQLKKYPTDEALVVNNKNQYIGLTSREMIEGELLTAIVTAASHSY